MIVYSASALSGKPTTTSSISSIITDRNLRCFITICMMFMCFHAILYEILLPLEQVTTTYCICFLSGGIIGVINTENHSVIHNAFATITFLSIWFFFFFSSTTSIFYYFQTFLLFLLLVFKDDTNSFFPLQCTFLFHFMVFYLYRHFLLL